MFFRLNIHKHTHTRTHARTHARAHPHRTHARTRATHTHTHTDTHAHARIHVHARTHTHAHISCILKLFALLDYPYTCACYIFSADCWSYCIVACVPEQLNMLRSFRRYSRAESRGHHTIDRWSVQQSSSENITVNQTKIKIVSKLTPWKLQRDWLELVRAFPGANIFRSLLNRGIYTMLCPRSNLHCGWLVIRNESCTYLDHPENINWYINVCI